MRGSWPRWALPRCPPGSIVDVRFPSHFVLLHQAEGTNLSHELKQQSSQRRGTAGAACSLQSEETRNQSRSGNRTTSTAGVPKQQFTRSRSNNWTASTARGLPEATIYQKQRRSGGCPCPVVRGDSRPEPEAKQQSSNEHHNDVSPFCATL